MMEIVAWLAVMLVFASFFMKTIVPLRVLAIASNLTFITYGMLGVQHGDAIFNKVLPILVLHCALLPVNLMRLREARSAIDAVRSMQGSHHTADLLAPYMHTVTAAAGTVLYRLGDNAERVYVLKRGAVQLKECGKTVLKDELFGEVDIFLEKSLCTTTAICVENCELLCVSAEKVVELFFHDQRIAFQLTRRLATQRSASAERRTEAAYFGHGYRENRRDQSTEAQLLAANDSADADSCSVASPAASQLDTACGVST